MLQNTTVTIKATGTTNPGAAGGRGKERKPKPTK